MSTSSATTPLDDLKQVETLLDTEVETLPLTSVPLRGVLAMLHGTLSRAMFGDKVSGGPADQGVAEAIAARIFGMWPALQACTVDVDGAYREMLEAYQAVDRDGSQLALLMGYGHLCELMPEVHAGLWTVSGDRANGFTLDHASDDLRMYEATDWLLLQLSLPFVVGPLYVDPTSSVRTARKYASPQVAAFELMAEARERRAQYVRLLQEPPLLTPAGFREAVDVGRNTFRRIQAACLALADVLVSLGNAHYGFGHLCADEHARDEEFWRAMEYASALWEWDALVTWLALVAAADEEDVKRILGYFAFEVGTSPDNMIGEGYWPPLTRMSDDVIVCPALLRLFMAERNVLYVLNRTDRKRFDEVVSRHLEPQLLVDASRLLTEEAGFEVATEVRFPGGEMDLLAYDADSNRALHLQAKAAVHPSGGADDGTCRRPRTSSR